MSNTWMLRPSPHDENRMTEFLSNNFIAIGWFGIGNLKNVPREQLKVILSQPPYQLASLELGNAYATVDIFVNQMNIDDIVLVPNGDEIHFCIIKSDYFFDPIYDSNQTGYSHQRKVEWLSSIQRKNLPMDVRSSLKAHRTATNLTKHHEMIKALAYGNPLPATSSTNDISNYVSVDYPLRPNVKITVTVPQDITKTESERLGDFIKTLYFQ